MFFNANPFLILAPFLPPSLPHFLSDATKDERYQDPTAGPLYADFKRITATVRRRQAEVLEMENKMLAIDPNSVQKRDSVSRK